MIVAVHLDPKSKLLGKLDFLVLKKDEGKKHMLILSDHHCVFCTDYRKIPNTKLYTGDRLVSNYKISF